MFMNQIKVGPARKTELEMSESNDLPRTTIVTNRDGKSLVRRVARNTFIHEAKVLDFKQFRGVQPINDITQIYQWTKVLGSGSYGQVHEAVNLKAKVSCAVKIISKKRVYKSKVTSNLVKKELEVL